MQTTKLLCLLILTFVQDGGFVVRPVQPPKPEPTPAVDTGKWVVRSVKPAEKSVLPSSPKKPVKKPADVYTWAVKRIAMPVGYRDYKWELVDYGPQLAEVDQATALRHLFTDHAEYFGDVVKYCDLSTMSYADIDAIHSCIHSAENGHMSAHKLVEEIVTCDVDPTKPCVHTFTFYLP